MGVRECQYDVKKPDAGIMTMRSPSSNGERNRAAYRARIYERYASDWQDAAPEFDESGSRRWGKAYRYYLRGWLPESKDANIIDVACGGGRLLHFFKTQGYNQLSGVDVSPTQVRLAQQVIPKVCEGDVIEYLEAHPGEYDLISGLDIVEHFHKPEVLRFLDASRAALKLNGRLILQTPNADSPWSGAIRYGDFTHEVGFTPSALSRLLQMTGFKETEAREMGPVPFGYSMASTLRYLVWRTIRVALKVWNVAETGNAGSRVFTRVFLITGIRK